MSQYDLKLKKVYYNRSHYYLNTNKGQFLLRRVYIPKEQIKFQYEVNQQLIEKGFKQIEAICLTKKQIPYMLQLDKVYILQTYKDVEDIDFKKEEDLVGAVQLLAHFHKHAKGIVSETRQIEEANIRNIYDYFYKRKKESKNLKKSIISLSKKSSFERMFLEDYQYYEELEERALELVDSHLAKKLVLKTIEEKTIAHNEFHYYAVGKQQTQGYMLNHLDACTYNIQLTDLAYVLIKIMQKNDWDIYLLERLIQVYIKENNLSQEECSLLKAMLIFPEKYAGMCHKYIHSKRRNHYSMFELKWENMIAYKEDQLKAAQAIEKYL